MNYIPCQESLNLIGLRNRSRGCLFPGGRSGIPGLSAALAFLDQRAARLQLADLQGVSHEWHVVPVQVIRQQSSTIKRLVCGG